MTDLEFDPFEAPVVTEAEPAPASTPLRRHAGRLQKVLPPGWRVEIVDSCIQPGGDDTAALRVVMPD
ncbi:hypothetical protein [Nocardia lijiangensis]|uniref:hypothetical protein n=1 Tax=Nocardia lijiangensis TaxID=299618 RepID=UPI00082D0625|nr:hypothetical protein [Nocardia lijiangensis]